MDTNNKQESPIICRCCNSRGLRFWAVRGGKWKCPRCRKEFRWPTPGQPNRELCPEKMADAFLKGLTVAEGVASCQTTKKEYLRARATLRNFILTALPNPRDRVSGASVFILKAQWLGKHSWEQFVWHQRCIPYDKVWRQRLVLVPEQLLGELESGARWIPMYCGLSHIQWCLWADNEKTRNDWQKVHFELWESLVKHTQIVLGDPRGVTEQNFPLSVAEIVWRVQTRKIGRAKVKTALVKALLRPVSRPEWWNEGTSSEA